MRNKFLKISSFALLLLPIFSSCDKLNDDVTNSTPVLGKGFYVLNEGQMTKGNSSYSYFSYKDITIANNIFASANSQDLGDVLQNGFMMDSTLLALVVKGNNKVVFVNPKTNLRMGEITGLDYPSAITFINKDKAYLACGTTKGVVYQIDLHSFTILDTVKVGYGPEHIIYSNNKVYVSNSRYYNSSTFSNVCDSTISVIDPNTNSVKTVVLSGKSPATMKVDSYGNIWTICLGEVSYDASYNQILTSPCKLVKIDSNSNSEVLNSSLTLVPNGIASNGIPDVIEINKSTNDLYYSSGYGMDGVYRINLFAPNVNASKFLDFASSGIKYISDYDQLVICRSAADYSSKGHILRYKPSGEKIDEFEVGVNPTTILF